MAVQKTLRRPVGDVNLMPHRPKLIDNVQEPEKAVKAGGLPAMLKSLRLRAASMKTSSSASERSSPGNCLEISDLEKNIIRQVEYYFGDYNLPKDRFMHEQMDEDGWISMDVMLTFKRLKELSLDVDLIMEALCKSPRKVVQVNVAGRLIRRHPEAPLPLDDETTKLEVESRTVFVSGFHRETTTLDDLLKFFETGEHGNVCNVKMRYRRNRDAGQEQMPEEDRKFLGSIFLTFESVKHAKDFVQKVGSGNVKYEKRRLNAKTKKEFLDQRIENNDEFSASKIKRTIYVHGFDKIDLSDQDVADFFSKFEGAESVRKRVYRDNNTHDEGEGEWKFNGSVFVCFDSERNAEAFVRQHRKNPVTYQGDRLRVKTQLDYYEQTGKFQRKIREFKESS